MDSSLFGLSSRRAIPLIACSLILAIGVISCQDGSAPPQIEPHVPSMPYEDVDSWNRYDESGKKQPGPEIWGTPPDVFTSAVSGVNDSAADPSNTPYVNFLLRQPNCSLTYGSLDGSGVIHNQASNFQDYLHYTALSSTTADSFTGGCKAATTGITSQIVAWLGTLSNGQAVLANVSPDGVQITIATAPLGTQVSQTDYSTLTQTEVNSQNAAVFGIVSADINGDGVQDIIVAQENDQFTSAVSLAVLLGQANGTFVTGQVLTVPMTAPSGTVGPVIGVTVADVNGDGKLDLIAVTNSSSSGVTVFLGNGDGTFRAGIAGPLGSKGQTAVVADFNNDGKPDIATSYGQVLLGAGDGTFTLVSQALPESLEAAVTAADYNHDGKIDLAFLDNGDAIDVFFGNGDGTFTYSAGYPAIESGESLQSSDLDGDGFADLFVGSAQGGLYAPDTTTNGLSQAAMNRGDGTFGPSRAYFSGSSLYDVADFDGDGKPDIVTIARSDGTGTGRGGVGTGAPVLTVLKGAGDGTFAVSGSKTPVSLVPDVQYIAALAAADLTGSGAHDVVYAGGGSSSGVAPAISVARGNNDGTFQAPQNYPIPGNAAVVSGTASASPLSLLLADVNGDGKPDIVFIASPDGTSSSSTAVYVMLNNGSGAFASAQLIAAEPYLSYLAAQDMNADGKVDLVLSASGVLGTTAGGAYLALGNGDGTFQAATALSPGPTYPTAVAIADMNGDGKPDLVFAGTNSGSGGGTISVRLGNGNGTFQSAITSAASSSDVPSGIAILDFNGDGKPDVVVGGSTSPFLLAGDGTGALSGASDGYLLLGANTGRPKAVDLTGRGLTDLLVATSIGVDVFVASLPPSASTSSSSSSGGSSSSSSSGSSSSGGGSSASSSSSGGSSSSSSGGGSGSGNGKSGGGAMDVWTLLGLTSVLALALRKRRVQTYFTSRRCLVWRS